MLIATDWKDYELIDMDSSEKLERFGEYIMIRPDPQIIWNFGKDQKLWNKCHMQYHRSQSGGGSWENKKPIPEKWVISYNDLKFYIKPTDFKHVGIFPEQAINWQWIIDKIKKSQRHIRVLNLFAYTGGATVAATYAGADVCHVDASKGMNNWAKENIALSKLDEKHVRFITDDVIKFVEREKRRNSFYDAIIMDPPSYGRGPNGEVWKIENNLYNLVNLCADILTDKPLFFLINSYTTGFSPAVVENILRHVMRDKPKGQISSGEIGLNSTSGYILPCGIYGRWENSNQK